MFAGFLGWFAALYLYFAGLLWHRLQVFKCVVRMIRFSVGACGVCLLVFVVSLLVWFGFYVCGVGGLWWFVVLLVI